MCGGSDPVPQMVQAQQANYDIKSNLGDTGQGFLTSLQAKQNQGLPEELKALLLKVAEDSQNGALTSARRAMTESTAGRNLPTGALIRPMADMYSNKAGAMTKTNTDIAMGDYKAKQDNYTQALQGFLGLQGMASGIAGQKNSFNLGSAGQQNQYNMNKYQIDEANKFNWGSLLGSLLSAGGTVGGAAIGASRREYKKNIKFIRNVKGINFYNFEYKDSKHGTGLQYGVMIDELEKILPEAIIGDKVDYNIVNSYIGE